MFLHGFPEFWYGWQKQLAYFASHGYRAIAPDQRGYNQSSKPTQVHAYVLEELVQDIRELIQHTPQQKVILVGHDWGGAVAWALALWYPELVHQLVILNMPYPGILSEQIKKHPQQLLRSWYAGFFQIPWAPEQVSQAFDFALLEKSMQNTARQGAFSPEDFQHYKEAWKQPHALTCMINWYRAFPHSKAVFSGSVTVPTLMLWGSKDTFLEKAFAQPSIDHCKNGRLLYLEKATHWLHHEFPEEVNQQVHQFISEHEA